MIRSFTADSSDEKRKKILARFYSLDELFSKIKEMCDWGDHLHLNRAILRDCVESYFADVERIKKFHKIVYADPHKKAAYTIKWLMKLRPVQTMAEDASVSDIFANEFFAVCAAVSFMDVSVDSIEDEFLLHLIYCFRYRDIDAPSLASLMYLLEINCKGRAEHPG